MDKEYFIAEKKQLIKVNELFIDTLNSIIPVITKFDNKVYNKRLITAFQKVGTDKDIHYSMKNDRVEIYCLGDLRMVKDSKDRFLGHLNRDTVWLYIHFNKDSKIDSEKTIDIVNNLIVRCNNYINSYKDCIENYDTYIKRNNEFIQAIKEYKESVPNSLRLNITYSSPF